jgi:hypothetical protein
LSPEIKEWAPKDPELTKVSGTDEFKKIVGPSPDTDFWAIGPFADQAEVLKSYGLTSPGDLAGQGDSFDLQALLQLPTVAFENMIRIATFVAAVERLVDPPMKDYAVSAVMELTEIFGLEARDLDDGWITSHSRIVDDIHKSLLKLQAQDSNPPKIRTFKIWIQSVGEAARAL